MYRQRLGRYRGSDVTPDTGNKQETVETMPSAIGNEWRGKAAKRIDYDTQEGNNPSAVTA
jgi:hypothetical protein